MATKELVTGKIVTGVATKRLQWLNIYNTGLYSNVSVRKQYTREHPDRVLVRGFFADVESDQLK